MKNHTMKIKLNHIPIVVTRFSMFRKVFPLSTVEFVKPPPSLSTVNKLRKLAKLVNYKLHIFIQPS